MASTSGVRRPWLTLAMSTSRRRVTRRSVSLSLSLVSRDLAMARALWEKL
uniref:Uncharacterized protein n=1 Tax=Triticum urartu TaxID=4572 RepID=A0A8R7NYQ1_TRIUA